MTRNVVFSLYTLIAVLAITVGCAKSSGEASRSMSNLESAISRLLISSSDGAFLIVNVVGSPDFIQLSGYRGTAELDFPQITDRQKQLRPRIEEVCGGLGLTQRVTRGSNGEEFIDCDLPSDAGEIAEVLRTILMDVYDVSDNSELEFEANGFDLPAA